MADVWNDEADVVVVGYGGAGASAAISAHDAGASVVIIEKDSGGGNTRLATNAFVCPINNAAAREHLRILSSGATTDEIANSFLDWSAKNTEFIKELGGEVLSVTPGPTFAHLAGSETMLRFRVKGPSGERGGASLWNLLSKNVQQRKIRVQQEMPGKNCCARETKLSGSRQTETEAPFGVALIKR